jgi:hypothetical protein
MRPGREQHAAAHVERKGAEQHFALACQQRLSVQEDAHAGPVGNRHQRWHRQLGVGHVEQTGNIAAGPYNPAKLPKSDPG